MLTQDDITNIEHHISSLNLSVELCSSDLRLARASGSCDSSSSLGITSIKNLGVIPDGNRRWAKQKGVPNTTAYRQGLKNVIDLVTWCIRANIPHLTLFGFSDENWQRQESKTTFSTDNIENTYLTFTDLFKAYKDLFIKHKVKIQFIGDLGRFGERLNGLITTIHNGTFTSIPKITVWICASYGGKQEIVAGVNKLLNEGKKSISLESFNEYLWSSQCPDVDAIIRTSGEKRLSGFMTWKSIYAELFFIDELWPDFSFTSFKNILLEFNQRNRRFGL